MQVLAQGSDSINEAMNEMASAVQTESSSINGLLYWRDKNNKKLKEIIGG